LTRVADETRNPRLAAIARRLGAPLRVAVHGRPGVGRHTVARALAAAGVDTGVEVSADGTADVDVVVAAEVLKPEDEALLGGGPAVLVLNKADLCGFGGGGPLAVAHRLAAAWRAGTGVPAVPMVALLAVADLDDDLLGVLRVLVAEPADLTSTDAFTQCAHSLAVPVRRRLIERLDRFGIAHAVLALGNGVDAEALPSLWRELSQVDCVVAQVAAAGAPVRYHRLKTAIAEIRTLAVQSDDRRLTDLLADDDTVQATMAAAVDVVEAAGVCVDRGDDPGAHLARAVHWRRYGRGPVDALHRSCAADITRGSLRLLGRTR